MKKEMKIIIAIIIAVALVAIIIVVANQSPSSEGPGSSLKPGEKDKVELSEDLPEESRQLVEELVGDRELNTIENTEFIEGEGGEGDLEGEGTQAVTRQIKTVTVARGNSPIDIERGVVVTPTGEDVDLRARAGTGNAPRVSFPLENLDDLPASTIRLELTSYSITPSEFTVAPGQLVNLAVSNTNSSTLSEVFRFEDPALNAVVMGLSKGETRSMSFNAPEKAGEYIFFSSQFNHRAQGAEGKMIVQ